MNLEHQPNTLAIANCTNIVSSRSQVECCKFSPSGSLLAACFSDGSVRLYTILHTASAEAKVELRHHFKEHQSNVWSISFSVDGLYLASASSDCTVIVYSIADLIVKHTHTDHINTVWCCAFSRLSLLATGSRDCTVKLYKQENDEMLYSISSFTSTVLDVSFNDAGDKLCTATSNGEIIVWVNMDHVNSTTPPVGLLILKNIAARLCRFITSNDLIACSTTHPNHDIVIYDIHDCIAADQELLTHPNTDDYHDVQSFTRVSQQLKGHCNIVWSFCCLQFKDAEMLITCSGDRTIRCWNLKTCECTMILRQFPCILEPNSQILSCDSVSCNNKCFVCVGTYNGKLYLFS